MLVGASPFNIVFSFNVCKREYDIFRHMICACVCVRVRACVCLNIDSNQYTVVPMSGNILYRPQYKHIVPSQILDFKRHISTFLFCLFNCLGWEVVVCFVDIDGIVDHHHWNLNFIFITLSMNYVFTLCKKSTDWIWKVHFNKLKNRIPVPLGQIQHA